MILFCLAILFAGLAMAQPKAAGLYDSLNGKIKSKTTYFFNITKDAKG
jgi:hypothetical protein